MRRCSFFSPPLPPKGRLDQISIKEPKTNLYFIRVGSSFGISMKENVDGLE